MRGPRGRRTMITMSWHAATKAEHDARIAVGFLARSLMADSIDPSIGGAVDAHALCNAFVQVVSQVCFPVIAPARTPVGSWAWYSMVTSA